MKSIAMPFMMIALLLIGITDTSTAHGWGRGRAYYGYRPRYCPPPAVVYNYAPRPPVYQEFWVEPHWRRSYYGREWIPGHWARRRGW